MKVPLPSLSIFSELTFFGIIIDLQTLLAEVAGDVQLAATRISEGAVSLS
jgi:hypothetical protein